MPVSGRSAGTRTDRESLREFVRVSRMDVPTDVPTQAALSALNSQRGRVCPLKCSSGESEVGGRCVAKAPAQAHKPQPKKRAPSDFAGELTLVPWRPELLNMRGKEIEISVRDRTITMTLARGRTRDPGLSR